MRAVTAKKRLWNLADYLLSTTLSLSLFHFPMQRKTIALERVLCRLHYCYYRKSVEFDGSCTVSAC